MTDESVAYRALNMAKEAKQEIKSHEDICAERYGNINSSVVALGEGIKGIKSGLWKAGSVGFAIIMSVLGYLAAAQFDNNTRVVQQIQDQMRQDQLSRATEGRPTNR